MDNKSKIIVLSTMLIASSISTCFAKAQEVPQASDRFLYIGTEAGIATPAVSSFKHKNSKFTLKRSNMIGGKAGYSFYPGMAAEASYTHQPKYKMSYTLPSVEIAMGPLKVNIPSTSGQSSVSANVFTANFIYELDRDLYSLKPYVIFGAGVARIAIKENINNIAVKDVPAFQAFADKVGDNVGMFKLHKNSSSNLAWQAGLGLVKDLTDNFAIDFSAKLQVVHDIKLKYSTFNPEDLAFKEQKAIKKTLGVGEFTFGLTWKLPI